MQWCCFRSIILKESLQQEMAHLICQILQIFSPPDATLNVFFSPDFEPNVVWHICKPTHYNPQILMQSDDSRLNVEKTENYLSTANVFLNHS